MIYINLLNLITQLIDIKQQQSTQGLSLKQDHVKDVNQKSFCMQTKKQLLPSQKLNSVKYCCYSSYILILGLNNVFS